MNKIVALLKAQQIIAHPEAYYIFMLILHNLTFAAYGS